MKFTTKKLLNLAEACKIELLESEIILYKSNLEEITNFIENSFANIETSLIAKNKAFTHGIQQNQVLIDDSPISEPDKDNLI